MIKFLILIFITISLGADSIESYLKKYKHEKKYALIIGNDNYKFFAKLNTAINDVKDMRFILAKKGFNTIYLENANKKDMKQAVRIFYKKIKKGGVGLFYYAGQGIEVSGKNYLIPVNADIKEIEDVETEAFCISEVTSRMAKANNRANIIILDASRTNPFTRGRGKNGLTDIRNTKNIFVAYASEPGKAAYSKRRKNPRNGLFTKSILKYIQVAGINVDEVFNRVRKEVNRASNGRQTPYASTGLTSTFYFTLLQKRVEPRDSVGTILDGEYIQKVEVNNIHTDANLPLVEKKKFSLDKFKLTINTTPPDTEINFIGKTIEYFDGMELQKGLYSIRVSKEGYISKMGKVDLKKDTVVTILLDASDKKEVIVKKKNIQKRKIESKNSKSVWIDPISELMWEIKTAKNRNITMNWGEAKSYCSNLTLNQFKNWRLPAKKELESVMTKQKQVSGYHIKKELSKQIGKWGWYWSKTDKNDSAFYVAYYNDGIFSSYPNSGKFYVRCVRKK